MAKQATNMFPETTPSVNKNIMPAALVSLLVLALIIATAAAAYLYLQNRKLSQNPQVAAQQQVQDIIAKVSHLILLPEGETPTIATVADPKLLSNQPFFDKSQKGDALLIYTNAKEAILYRPSTNMIINVAPLSIGTGTPATTTAPSTTTSPTTTKKP